MEIGFGVALNKIGMGLGWCCGPEGMRQDNGHNWGIQGNSMVLHIISSCFATSFGFGTVIDQVLV